MRSKRSLSGLGQDRGGEGGKPMVYSLVGHCNVLGPDSDWNGKLLEGVA